MNSGLRRRAFRLSALLVSRIDTHTPLPGIDLRQSDWWYSGGSATRGFSGTILGLLFYLIAIVAVPLISAARLLGRNTATEMNRAVVAESRTINQ
jgi:hypothetical protein